MRPRVSLIIPVYNAHKFLKRCIDSAVAQTEPSLEIICVDDASTDDSAEMLEAYAARDSRLRVVRREVNGGESAARNQGVALANGEYLAFLDHDDKMEPDACRLLYEAARAADADIAKGRVKTIDQTGRVSLSPLQLHKDICEKSKFFFAFSWWSGIYRASLVKNRIFFAEEYPIGGDVLFLTEAVLAAQSIVCVDDLVCTHFLHAESNAGGIFPPAKIRSTIASRLRIMNILHEAGVDANDIEGYLFKITHYFREGVSLINNNCGDDASRDACCEYIFKLADMHRYPKEFFLRLEEDIPVLTDIFRRHSLDDLKEYARTHKIALQQQKDVLARLRRTVSRDMRIKVRPS